MRCALATAVSAFHRATAASSRRQPLLSLNAYTAASVPRSQAYVPPTRRRHAADAPALSGLAVPALCTADCDRCGDRVRCRRRALSAGEGGVVCGGVAGAHGTLRSTAVVPAWQPRGRPAALWQRGRLTVSFEGVMCSKLVISLKASTVTATSVSTWSKRYVAMRYVCALRTDVKNHTRKDSREHERSVL